MVSNLTADQLQLFSEVVEDNPSITPEEIRSRCDQFAQLIKDGQIDKADPLYAKMLNATARIRAMYGEFEESYGILEQILTLALADNNKVWINKTRNNMALVRQYQGNIFEAIEIWKEILKDRHDISETILYHNNLGIAYYRSGKHGKALDTLLSAKELLEKEEAGGDLADIYTNLGNIYRETGFPEKAEAFYQSALEIYERKQDQERLSRIYNNLCVNAISMKDTESAERFGRVALEMYKTYQPPRLYSVVLNNYANIRLITNQWDEARSYYNQALDSAFEHKNHQMQITCLNNLALCANKLDEYDQAIEYIQKALVITEESGIHSEKGTSLNHLIDAYQGNGSYKEAFETQQRLIAMISQDVEANPKLSLALAESEHLQNRLEKQFNAIAESNELLETQNNLLSATNLLLNRMISVITHDVRGPIATIAHSFELFEQDLITEEEKAELTLEIGKSAKRTTRLIDDLLDLAHKYKSGLDEEAELLEINQVMRSSIDLVEATARHKNISLSFVSDKDPLQLYISKGRIQLILRNLLLNAIKFSHPLSTVSLKLKLDQEYIYLIVADQGIGMDKAQVNAILSGASYSRLGTNSEKGFGMGLVFVLEAILYTKGHLTIDSIPGEGSTFTIRYLLDDLKVPNTD